MSNHPQVTYSQLKDIFHDGLCCTGYRFKGLLCSEEVYNTWNNKNKSKRYMPDGTDRRLKSSDDIIFFVNTQWTKDGIKGIINLAKAEGFRVSIKTPEPTLFIE